MRMCSRPRCRGTLHRFAVGSSTRLHVWSHLAAAGRGCTADEDEAETAQLHLRKVAHTGGINRVRACPQQPHLVASWADTAQVQLWDLGEQLAELRDEAVPVAGASGKVHKVNARHVHTHSSGGWCAVEGSLRGWVGW
jgi:hypothetical protein